MKVYCKIIIALLSLVIIFNFYGCPHLTESMVKNDTFYEERPPEDYAPVYKGSSKSLEDLFEDDSLMISDSMLVADSIRYVKEFRDSILHYYSDSLGFTFDVGKGVFFSDSIGSEFSLDSIVEFNSNNYRKHSEIKYPDVYMEVNEIISDKYPKEVEIRVNVFDDVGFNVSGLAPPNFTGKGDYHDYWINLSDSSKCIDENIKDFKVEEISSETSESFAIAFVLDHSGSMGEEKSTDLQKGVRLITSAIKKDDWVSVIKFGDKMNIEIPLTDDRTKYRQVIVEGLNASKNGMGTAMYRAVLTGVEELKKAPDTHKKIIILFSDGEDGDWKFTEDSVQRVAIEEDVKIYTVAYGRATERYLKALSEPTKGKFYKIYDINEFPYVFGEIYLALNNYYKITYSAPECGDLHYAGVTLNVPELRVFGLYAEGTYDQSLFRKLAPIGTVTFLNIEFESGKAVIAPDAMPLLENIAEEMKKKRFLKLEIRGHTDDVGSEEDNLKLSNDRANAVMNKLIELGIDKERLRAVGFGESRPLVENNSEENRRRNRRTEFVIMDK